MLTKNDYKKPQRCIDPVMKYCQECRYGIIEYPDSVESFEDTYGCVFDTHCIYGLENTKPTQEELEKFKEWCKKG